MQERSGCLPADVEKDMDHCRQRGRSVVTLRSGDLRQRLSFCLVHLGGLALLVAIVCLYHFWLKKFWRRRQLAKATGTRGVQSTGLDDEEAQLQPQGETYSTVPTVDDHESKHHYDHDGEKEELDKTEPVCSPLSFIPP